MELIFILSNSVKIYKYLYNINVILYIYKSDYRKDKKESELSYKINEILRSIDDKDITNIYLCDLEVFCKDEWKLLILKTTQKIKNKINSRFTRGIGFRDILNSIEEIEQNLNKIEKIEAFEKIYNTDIKILRRETAERIVNERFNIFFPLILSIIGISFAYYLYIISETQ